MAGPWELTFSTSLVTSVVNSARKLDAWVTSVNGYKADFSSTRKPDSADLAYFTTCSFPPLSSFLYSPLPLLTSLLHCSLCPVTRQVSSTGKVKARILPDNVSFPSCHQVFIALRSYLYKNAKIHAEYTRTHHAVAFTFQGQILNVQKNQGFWSLLLSFSSLLCSVFL